MKKVFIPAILLLIAITVIAFSFRACKSEGDDSVKKQSHPAVAIDSAMQMRIDSFVTAVPYVGKLGLMVYDITARQEIYSYNADVKMSPASCMKILTCVVALKKFGKSAVHKTRLYTTGKMVGDTLIGDIILKSQFDPMFVRDSLYKMTEVLQTKGIKNVKGRVVLDMADYDAMNHEEHWTPGDLRTRYLGLPFAGGVKMRKEMLYALMNAGITVNSKDIIYGRLNYAASKLVCEIRTPMRLSIEKAMKNSSNINAESLLYPLGYTKSSKGNFRNNGIEVLREFVTKELHMTLDKNCTIDDGCGLCPNDKLTPRLLVNLLTYVYDHRYIFDEIYTALPLSGTDGTLHDRLRKPNVKGRIKAKTGTLTKEGGISSLSGYYKADNGHMIVFSIINNECPVMDGRWWQDKFLTKIVR